ncbi:HD-GYP domain-containing protein [Desulfovibrio sp. UCD-KL4C]|uniref:HD-GYP domain-containing protein n=1 Tax=Desulfovibrio sp. UCD-KL4C TaxID=2578120 RepID=UPI0025C09E2A|nr:HD-GYP domain-containing protein [Desulfovibrio sp. UCD-KL4C]
MRDVIDIVGALAEKRASGYDLVHETVHQFAESLGNAIDAKDTCTSSHSDEVAVISKALGVQIRLKPDECRALHIAGHLHDIGKIGIPDSILKKKGKLTDEEYEVVKEHPVIGSEIVSPVLVFSGENGITEMILYHHERFDGKGYPAGLKGTDIPFGARIIAVADTLSAIMQDRPYRKAMSFNHALKEIKRCSQTQFDPVVVNALLEVSDKVQRYLSEVKNHNGNY